MRRSLISGARSPVRTVTLSNPDWRHHYLHRRGRPNLQLPPDGEEYRWLNRPRANTTVSAVSAALHADHAVLRQSRPASPPVRATTLIWVTQNATSVSISPGVGTVNHVRLGLGHADGNHHLHPDRHRPQRHGQLKRPRSRSARIRSAADRPLRGQPAQHRAGRSVDPELDHQQRHDCQHQPASAP